MAGDSCARVSRVYAAAAITTAAHARVAYAMIRRLMFVSRRLVASVARELWRGRPRNPAVRSKVVGFYRDRVAIPEVVDLVGEPIGANIELPVTESIELIEWIGAIHLDSQRRQ